MKQVMKISYHLDLYGTFHIKNVDNFVGPKTEIVVELNSAREQLEHSQYTREKELREFYKDQIIEVDCEECVLETLEFKYFKMLLIVNVGTLKRYFILDKKNCLIFIPLCNNQHNIIDYGFTDLVHLDKVKEHSFHRCLSKNGKKKYVATGENVQLHEIILGGPL